MINKIKEAREKAGKLQKECADEIGVTLRAWQTYEQGTREPRFELLVKIADFLGVTTDYLLGREAEPPDPIDALANFFHMSPIEKNIIRLYLESDDTIRKGIIKIVETSAAQSLDEEQHIYTETTLGEIEDKLTADKVAESGGEKSG